MDNDLRRWSSALEGLLQSLAHQTLDNQGLLEVLAQFCVDHLDAAFARIWLIDDAGTTLLLRASRGQYTRLDGTRARIPIGQGSKIDKMYVECVPHVTNDTLNDPGVKDKEWARREAFVAFAGYPLCWGNRKLGVLGMYSRAHLSEDLLQVLGIFALLTAAVIYQSQQAERNMHQFCDVTGFKPALLQRLIVLGKRTDGEHARVSA